MSVTIKYLQNSGNGNVFATVNGMPKAGAGLVSQPYSGAPVQQWIAAQYPGTDKTNSDGVVFVLYYGGTSSSQLVITAAAPVEPVTLQPFQKYNLHQLWSYAGVEAGGALVNLATGGVLDVTGGIPSGGVIQTWPTGTNKNQQWTLATEDDAALFAREAEAKEALVAG